MHKRNIPRLKLGTRVHVALWMIGAGGRNRPHKFSHGTVAHVTPAGGVLVKRADGAPRWYPYHAVRVTGAPNGEPV